MTAEITTQRRAQRPERTPETAPFRAKKRPSMRSAINAFCKGCIYDPSPGLGTWRQQVEGCEVTDCPLYPLRPVSSGREVQR